MTAIRAIDLAAFIACFAVAFAVAKLTEAILLRIDRKIRRGGNADA
jgi:hypothetical protein